MLVLKNPQALKREIHRLKKQKKKIGFVPTMGFLHEGHLSIVRKAKKQNEIVVVSIFVNPLQFGPKEDFKRYPRNLKRDGMLLKKVKTDILFIPEASDLYPDGFQTKVSLPNLSKPLCGISRPTHFTGVATVVLKLLNLVEPDALYLGQKDYQQFRVVEQMAKDLDLPVNVRMAATVREADGLAMSSRNVFLSQEERKAASNLFKAIQKTRKAIFSGDYDVVHLKQILRQGLKTTDYEPPGLVKGRVDYAEIVDAKTLASVVDLKPGDRILLAVAVFFGKTRLIDNAIVSLRGGEADEAI